MDVWALQDAKNRFSELVDCALTKGPQTVTRRGRNAVVVVSAEEFRRMQGPKADFVDFLLAVPRGELDLRRDDPDRDLGLE